MPELKCTVSTCAYNQTNLCQLDSIEVGGSSAMEPEDTCCDSFEERTGERVTNAVKEASDRCSINCHAVDCDYNEQRRCHAGKISIEGNVACQNEETACATFIC